MLVNYHGHCAYLFDMDPPWAPFSALQREAIERQDITSALPSTSTNSRLCSGDVIKDRE